MAARENAGRLARRPKGELPASGRESQVSSFWVSRHATRLGSAARRSTTVPRPEGRDRWTLAQSRVVLLPNADATRRAPWSAAAHSTISRWRLDRRVTRLLAELGGRVRREPCTHPRGASRA